MQSIPLILFLNYFLALFYASRAEYALALSGNQIWTNFPMAFFLTQIS